MNVEELVDREFPIVFKESLADPRFVNATVEEQNEWIRRGKMHIRGLIQMIVDRDYKIYKTHGLHRECKTMRRLFTSITGIELPHGSAETREIEAEYVGRDIIAQHENAKREFEEQQAQAKRDKETARINAIADKVKAGESIPGCDLLDLAKAMGVPVHPRTSGMIAKRVSAVGPDRAMVRGKSMGQSPFAIYKQVAAAISQ